MSNPKVEEKAAKIEEDKAKITDEPAQTMVAEVESVKEEDEVESKIEEQQEPEVVQVVTSQVDSKVDEEDEKEEEVIQAETLDVEAKVEAEDEKEPEEIDAKIPEAAEVEGEEPEITDTKQVAEELVTEEAKYQAAMLDMTIKHEIREVDHKDEDYSSLQEKAYDESRTLKPKRFRFLKKLPHWKVKSYSKQPNSMQKFYQQLYLHNA